MSSVTKFYIAFSIHGTNSFIIATRESGDDFFYPDLPDGFKIVASRRMGTPPTGLKIHWDKLLREDGVPLASPSLIIRRFSELEKMGWKVSKEHFVKRHYAKNKPDTVRKAPSLSRGRQQDKGVPPRAN